MTAAANPILRHLHRLAAGPAAALPDRDLLQRYLEGRDEAAFAALVERHGPLVLGVCLTVLRHRHDAEDAFQATFVVLARSARSIRRRDSLAGWLHGVAYRVAQKARAAAARRQALQAKAAPAAPVAPADDLSWAEVRSILHAELAALPERLREPITLCYLEGLTQEEAARRLGWTAATVKGRLQRGRERLRRRLERRGLGPAALGAMVLAGAARGAAVPRALTAAAVRAALPAAGTTAPATAAALAHGMGGPVVTGKVGVAAAALLLAAALAGGAALGLRPPATGGPPPAAPGPSDGPATVRADRFGDALPEGAVARLGTVRFNHGRMLNALHFTPDGKTVLSEGNGSLRLWDAASGKELGHFAAAKWEFDLQSALAPDGKTMIFLSQSFAGNPLRVWDLAAGKALRTVTLPVKRNETTRSRRNAIAPDARLCALFTPESIHVFDIATARELWQLPTGGRDEIRAMTFAGPQRLVTVDRKQMVHVWEARTGRLVRQFAHGAPAESVAASADGRRLATVEHRTCWSIDINRPPERDVVRVWDLATGTQKQELAARPKRWHTNVAFSPDGKLLFDATYGRDGEAVSVWDVVTGRRVHELSGASGTALVGSPDGRRLAAGGGWYDLIADVTPTGLSQIYRLAPYGGKFDLWDLKTGRRLLGDDSRDALAATVFLSPAGDRAFTVGPSSISTWDAEAGRRLRSFDVPLYSYQGPRRSHSPDGRYALTFAGDLGRLEILVWDVATGRLVQTLRPPERLPAQRSLYVGSAFAPDSSVLATWHPGETPVVRVWDLRTGKEVRSFPQAKPEGFGQIFFLADGKTLLLASRRVVGLEVASGKELFSWRMKPAPGTSRYSYVGRSVNQDDRYPWTNVTVSADGTTLAGILSGVDGQGVDDRFVLCEARTGKLRRRWGGPATQSLAEELAFSPDGRLLASSDGDAVHVWEAATGGEVSTFRGQRGDVLSLAFSGDGRRLASASADDTVLIWDVTRPAHAAGRPAGAPGEAELAAWWADLAGTDAGRAHVAVWRLAEAPGASVPFLRGRLKPVTEAEVKQARQHVADLDSDTFAVRRRALRQLEWLGPAAGPALREAQGKDGSAEVRRRVEELLEGLSRGPGLGEPLRLARAVAALEYAGTPEARLLLRDLANGAPGAWLTQEAQAALGRRARRPAGRR